jgi:hypothetical protein
MGDLGAAIQGAISGRLGANGGGIDLPAGTFDVATSIVCPSTLPTSTPSPGHVGYRIRGAGRGATVLNFVPAVPSFLVVFGDPNATTEPCPAIENVWWQDLTVTLGNANALGAFQLNDPCQQCGIERVGVFGQAPGAGIGVLLRGMVTACAFNTVRNFAGTNLFAGIQASGFGNSNRFSELLFGLITYGILADRWGTDTQGGSTNVVDRVELNGGTQTGIALRSNATGWTFTGAVADGPAVSLEIAASSDWHTFVGGALPNRTVASLNNTFTGVR